MNWRRSSSSESGTSIEVADDGGQVYLRSTQSGVIVHATRSEWAAFLAGVKAGEFDQEETE